MEPLLALALLFILFVQVFDWSLLRRPIEWRVSEATGREFRIDGDLSVALSLHPLIRLEDVTLGNVTGAADAEMARAEWVQFSVDLRKLLRGEVVLTELMLGAPRILLERNEHGVPNWQFGRGESAWPTIQQLHVSQGELRIRNPLTRTDLLFTFASGEPSVNERLPPLLVAGHGRYAGSRMRIEGRIASPLQLEDPERPFRVDLRAQAGSTHATAAGNLLGPLQLRGLDLDLGLAGPSLARLFPLIGVAVPDTPPYRLQGQLRYEAGVWQYEDFSGRVGDSDLRGEVTVLTGGTRPKLIADLMSNRLDFDDLGGFIGVPPQTSPGETASAEQRKAAEKLRAGARVLPGHEFNFDKLRNMDADVTLQARHVLSPALPIEAMTAHLYVDDAVLRLDPIVFRAAGGEISSHIRLDARRDTMASSAAVQARGLQLPKLFPEARLIEGSAGRVGGRIGLAGTGNSIARQLASADGDVSLGMGRGQISNLLMEFAGLDIAESLKFLIGKDRLIPIHCGFGDFDVADGVMTSRALVFDTSDTVIHGDGSVDLRHERLDLRLRPRPKDRSILALRVPLRLTGSFKDPSFQPDAQRMGLRAAAAGLLASLAPPAALLALYESGSGKDADCGRASALATGPR